MKKLSPKRLSISKETLINISAGEPTDPGKVGSDTCPSEQQIYTNGSWYPTCTW